MKSVPPLNLLILLSLLQHEAVLFAYSVILAVNVVSLDLSKETRSAIACRIGGETCSFCGNDDGQTECPEWTEDDLERVFRSELKQAATVAAILMVYSVGPLRFGFALRKHVSTYEVSSISFCVHVLAALFLTKNMYGLI